MLHRVRPSGWRSTTVATSQDEMSAEQRWETADDWGQRSAGIIGGRGFGAIPLNLLLLTVALMMITAGGPRMEGLFGVAFGDSALKGTCLALLLLAGLSNRPFRFPVPVVLLLTLLLLGCALTLVRSDLVVGPARAAQATLGLVVPWVAAGVRLADGGRLWLLRCVTCLPIASLGIAVALHFIADLPLVWTEFTGVRRLSSTLPSAYLGTLAFFAVAAACVLWLESGWRPAAISIICNLALVYATASRLALLVAGLALGATFCAGLKSGRWHGMPGFRPLLLAASVAAFGLIGRVASRTALGQAVGLADSGRSAAWQYLWSEALKDLAAGRGAGASYVLGPQSPDPIVAASFRAPHNTYLQVLVDYGVIIGVMAILALLAILATMVLRASAASRPAVLGLAVGLAIFGFFDNLLTVIQPALLTSTMMIALRDSAGGALRSPRAGFGTR
jgi:hypothetical protein